MPTVRFSAEDVRRKARIDRSMLDAATEADIAGQAAQDGTGPLSEAEISAMLRDGDAVAETPVDVADIRNRMGLSQERFAALFRISLHTLRNWEQRRRTPEGPARTLLLVIEREPEAVIRALAARPDAA